MPLAFRLPSDKTLDFRECFDISAPLGSAPVWPGDRPFSLQGDRDRDGSGCLLSALSLCSHSATHIDFPGHVRQGGRLLDDYRLQRFILPAWVVSIAGEKRAVTASALRKGLPGGMVSPGEAVLFKTDNSERRLLSRPAFVQDFVSISPDAAHLCAAGKAGLVGIDYLSVDEYGSESLPVHHILLEGDVLILEGIDLSAVPAGRYTLICLPLSLGGAEASPVRAVLLR